MLAYYKMIKTKKKGASTKIIVKKDNSKVNKE